MCLISFGALVRRPAESIPLFFVCQTLRKLWRYIITHLGRGCDRCRPALAYCIELVANGQHSARLGQCFSDVGQYLRQETQTRPEFAALGPNLASRSNRRAPVQCRCSFSERGGRKTEVFANAESRRLCRHKSWLVLSTTASHPCCQSIVGALGLPFSPESRAGAIVESTAGCHRRRRQQQRSGSPASLAPSATATTAAGSTPRCPRSSPGRQTRRPVGFATLSALSFGWQLWRNSSEGR